MQRVKDAQLEDLKNMMAEHKKIEKSMRSLNRLDTVGEFGRSRTQTGTPALNMASSLFLGARGTGSNTSLGDKEENLAIAEEEKEVEKDPELQTIASSED